MDADPPLDYLLDESTGIDEPPPGRQELLDIVARSRVQRRRVAAVTVAVTLVVGAAGGWFVGLASGRSSGGASVAAGSPSSTTTYPRGAPLALGQSSSVGFSALAAGGLKLTKSFVRTTADGVTLRAYQSPSTTGAPTVFPPVPGCPVLRPGLQVDASTTAVAAQVFSLLVPGTAPFKGFSVSTIGIAEGAPVWVATAQTDAGVAQVRAGFADGSTDQMAPVGGWVALAHVVPAGSIGSAESPPSGSLEALDGTGKVIGRVAFPAPVAVIPPSVSSPPPVGSGGIVVAPAKPALPGTVVGTQPVAPVTSVPGPGSGSGSAGGRAGAGGTTAGAGGSTAAGLPPSTLPPQSIPVPLCGEIVPTTIAIAPSPPSTVTSFPPGRK